MKAEWQLQDAKNRLSQVVDKAVHEGPQTITLRGKPTAVLISVDAFRKLTQRRTKLSTFFAESPLRGVTLDLTRRTDASRDIDL